MPAKNTTDARKKKKKEREKGIAKKGRARAVSLAAEEALKSVKGECRVLKKEVASYEAKDQRGKRNLRSDLRVALEAKQERRPGQEGHKYSYN